MQALSAAWLAHFDYGRLDIEAANVHVRSCIFLSNQSDDSIRSRVSLVVAQVMHLAGRYDLAKSWYIRANFHANREGDEATVGAILHNMAWLHMSNFRQAHFVTESMFVQDINILLSAESAKNFDLIFNVNTLAALEPILRAQIFSLRGQWFEALELYELYFCSPSIKGASRFLAISLADRTWCRLKIGEKSHIQEDIILVSRHLEGYIQIDERAAVYSRLSEIFEELGYLDEMNRYQQLAKNSWRSFLTLQESALELFGEMQ